MLTPIVPQTPATNQPAIPRVYTRVIDNNPVIAQWQQHISFSISWLAALSEYIRIQENFPTPIESDNQQFRQIIDGLAGVGLIDWLDGNRLDATLPAPNFDDLVAALGVTL